MRSRARNVPLVVALALLVVLLYPAIALNHRLAPEVSLKGAAPWRVQWGPFPRPSPLAVEAATHLGPRLASIARDGLAVALWNPWIGGGRPGWLSSPAEGGAPLVLLAGMLSRSGWAWTALVALQLCVSFLVVWWVLSRLGLGAWPAAIGGTTYALSGALVIHWLDWQGSGLALGPLALLPVLVKAQRWRHHVLAWAAVLALLALCGPPALPFVALALVMAALSRPLFGRSQRWGAAAVGAGLALLLVLPTAWLNHAGGEEGASATAELAGPAVQGWRAFFASASMSEPSEEAETPTADAAARADRSAFLGGVAVLLGVLGLPAMQSRRRGFWLGVLGVSLALTILPASLLSRVGLSQRPFGIVALATAVCAAHGAQALCRRLSPGVLASAVGLALWVLVGAGLAPPAARTLPFASEDEADLPSPLPAHSRAFDSRILGLLATLPPDVGATLGLADVRAASFSREPRYASLLGVGPAGELPVSRALDPRVARLGARWLLEPLPLHVVSGGVFSHIEVSETATGDGKGRDGLRRFAARVPAGACRVGLPAGAAGRGGLWIERPAHRRELEPDSALAAESESWQWFALPSAWPEGDAVLALTESPSLGTRMTVAWDQSGLRLRQEDRGVRVWEWETARPLASVASGVAGAATDTATDPGVVSVSSERLPALRTLTGATGEAHLAGATPSTIELEVTAQRPALVVVQVKFRPALWQVEVNGVRQRGEQVDGVWTGVVVPAGPSRVTLRARVPAGMWLVAVVPLLALVMMAAKRRD